MHPRRTRLAEMIALQTAAAASASSPDQIADAKLFPVREPGSGRTYTVVRLRTRSGVTGYGESGRVTASEAEKATRAVVGRPATSFGVTTTGTSLDGAITTAMVDIAAKLAKTPVYRLLGGPTRTKVRALVTLTGSSDGELKESMKKATAAGHRALQVAVPAIVARNQGQAFDRAARNRMEGLRTAAPNGVDFVLSGGGQLTPGDASSLAASLERFHLLWFDEPCAVSNLHAIRKISDECVTPLGFGRGVSQASVYQDLLREGLVDILRPDLQTSGIPRIRQIAALAETYYTAVAPNHEGGPVGTAAAIQLAASLPNFFIQHVPWPASEEDRRVRSEIVSGNVESVRDGFFALPQGPGLGVEVNESALEKYRDVTA